MADAKKQNPVGTINVVGMVVGLILLIVFGFLTATSKLASVSTNPYLSEPALGSITYGVLFGIGFVIFVSFLTVTVEKARGLD